MNEKSTPAPELTRVPRAAVWVDGILSRDDEFVPGWKFKAGGMENPRSAYLVLRHEDGSQLLVLERRNDDGEWAPLVFPAPDGLDCADEPRLLNAMGSIGEYADHLDEVGCGLAHSENHDAGDSLWNLLYLYRDTLTPGAVTGA